MTGIVIVADTGAALQGLTEAARELPHARIIRHCSGRSPVGAAIAAAAPDVVLVDEMRWPRTALLRIAEISAGGRARAILCTSRPEARWHADALRAGACAVVPKAAGATPLRLVVEDLLDSSAVEHPRDPALAA
jgi:DNA-binding NarL/FixJ family response regulator